MKASEIAIFVREKCSNIDFLIQPHTSKQKAWGQKTALSVTGKIQKVSFTSFPTQPELLVCLSAVRTLTFFLTQPPRCQLCSSLPSKVAS